MPLIVVKYDKKKILPEYLEHMLPGLAFSAAQILSCPEGGILKTEDIMIEASEHGPFDLHTKNLHVRVYAHDYPSRRERLDEIRKVISLHLVESFTAVYREGREPSWYVWVLLSETSYGSDTEGS